MTRETTRVRLWRIRRGEKADLFSTFPKGDPNAREVWVPRSLMHHVSVDPHNPDEWAPCTVEMDMWFAEKEDL